MSTTKSTIISGFQPPSDKIHALRASGRYASGKVRYVKVCGTSRNDRYLPSPTAEPAEITCQRCLAKIYG